MRKFNEHEKRALEYLDQGDVSNAVMSIVSELQKIGQNIPDDLMNRAMSSPQNARQFIIGFGKQLK